MQSETFSCHKEDLNNKGSSVEKIIQEFTFLLTKTMGNKEKTEDLELVRNLFNKWNEGLKTKSPETMASFYADNCSFLPTLNGELKR